MSTTGTDYKEEYSDKKFMAKLNKKIKDNNFVRNMVTMYCCLKDETTPAWVKGMIIGALVYFIFPMDVIPDVSIAIGYLDDAGVISGVLTTIQIHIKNEHYERADDFLSEKSAVAVGAEID